MLYDGQETSQTQNKSTDHSTARVGCATTTTTTTTTVATTTTRAITNNNSNNNTILYFLIYVLNQQPGPITESALVQNHKRPNRKHIETREQLTYIILICF
jgi:hypothetical protein